MKTKQQILEAIECCSKMGSRGEQACCSKCPFKKDVFCNIHLLKELKWYVLHDVSSFVKYLKIIPTVRFKTLRAPKRCLSMSKLGI